MRTRSERVEPEVYFRNVHVAPEGHNGGPMANYREQTFEIVMGPKGAFENCNIGTVTLRVPVGRIVSAALPPRGKSKPPREPRMPRVVEFLRKAIEWRRQLDASEVINQAEITRREGITCARVSQVLGLIRLAPEIQECILSIPKMIRRPPVTERMLRPFKAINGHRKQLQKFQNLFGRNGLEKVP